MSRLRIRLRWRLAFGVAVITFVIVASFAFLSSRLINNFLSGDLDTRLQTSAQKLANSIELTQVKDKNGNIIVSYDGPDLVEYTSSEGAAARITDVRGLVLLVKTKPLRNGKGLAFGRPGEQSRDIGGWRVVSVPLASKGYARVAFLQFALPRGAIQATMKKINFFLFVGVLFATTMSAMLSLVLSRRLLDPIRTLTSKSREISRTRNLGIGFSSLDKDDEFGELSLTLDEMIGSLEQSRDDLQHSLDRQKELVADASHELRTPLTSILTNLDILQDDLKGDDAELAASAERSAKRMQRIIEDLLVLARADRGQRTAAMAVVDLGEIVELSAAELKQDLASHQFQMSLARPLPVYGSGDNLNRLVINLLGNAARHCPEGSQIICQGSIFEKDKVLLTVADNGPGIAAGEREKVFERFYRIGGDRGGAGSGLGLAIAKTIAEDHGGQIQIGEGMGEAGVAFHIILPLAKS